MDLISATLLTYIAPIVLPQKSPVLIDMGDRAKRLCKTYHEEKKGFGMLFRIAFSQVILISKVSNLFQFVFFSTQPLVMFYTRQSEDLVLKSQKTHWPGASAIHRSTHE